MKNNPLVFRKPLEQNLKKINKTHEKNTKSLKGFVF